MNFPRTNFAEISEWESRSLSRCVPVLACVKILSASESFHALNILEHDDEEYGGELATFSLKAMRIPNIRLQISGAAQQSSWISKKRK